MTPKGLKNRRHEAVRHLFPLLPVQGELVHAEDPLSREVLKLLVPGDHAEEDHGTLRVAAVLPEVNFVVGTHWIYGVFAVSRAAKSNEALAPLHRREDNVRDVLTRVQLDDVEVDSLQSQLVLQAEGLRLRFTVWKAHRAEDLQRPLAAPGSRRRDHGCSGGPILRRAMLHCCSWPTGQPLQLQAGELLPELLLEELFAAVTHGLDLGLSEGLARRFRVPAAVDAQLEAHVHPALGHGLHSICEEPAHVPQHRVHAAGALCQVQVQALRGVDGTYEPRSHLQELSRLDAGPAEQRVAKVEAAASLGEPRRRRAQQLGAVDDAD
eukprot:CAMPEP_0118971714 /NCGR_PEP_ID=MMETSP1173-20130426/8254_1 /TAXON_ID=1034831 /ORGANISM="Rhizochromulina marina cf, Strain CCMP1243" /LENGTH=322 /DNA_ID=CAMNT_0006921193 /DNA_START=779 /DNA_END=1745 /DNA_ORIENTATION=-